MFSSEGVQLKRERTTSCSSAAYNGGVDIGGDDSAYIGGGTLGGNDSSHTSTRELEHQTQDTIKHSTVPKKSSDEENQGMHIFKLLEKHCSFILFTIIVHIPLLTVISKVYNMKQLRYDLVQR